MENLFIVLGSLLAIVLATRTIIYVYFRKYDLLFERGSKALRYRPFTKPKWVELDRNSDETDRNSTEADRNSIERSGITPGGVSWTGTEDDKWKRGNPL